MPESSPVHRVPEVSVLVPCFNDGGTLDEALASVAAQTFGDLEVIVSDDASQDSSIEIARRWAAGDSRFRLVTSENNQGAARNWNRALEEARGRFVTKLDADDLLAPEFLETLVAEYEKSPTPDVAFCRSVESDLGGSRVSPWRGERALRAGGLDPACRRAASGEAWLQLCFEDQQLWHSNAFLTTADRLRSMKGWDERLRCAQDTDLFLRILADSTVVLHVPLVGVRARHRRGSVSDRAEREGWKTVESILVHLEAIHRMIERRFELSPRLEWHWWRLWTALMRVAQDREVRARLPERLLDAVDAAATTLPAPPLSVRFRSRVRGAIHNIVRLGSRG
ncbi:MAG: hypothetical protein AMXMBFR36_17760 [Acidobacteriota bacterium]